MEQTLRLCCELWKEVPHWPGFALSQCHTKLSGIYCLSRESFFELVSKENKDQKGVEKRFSLVYLLVNFQKIWFVIPSLFLPESQVQRALKYALKQVTGSRLLFDLEVCYLLQPSYLWKL